MMISIIIVHYKVEKELFACIQSINKSKLKSSYEIIVVDNDETKTIEKNLKKKFPQVKYISNENKGFGQANNVGSSKAKGEYLYFLNPDTTSAPGSIDKLLSKIKDHKNIGIVAPLLHNLYGKPYMQGTKTLTPFNAIFALSFINKLFPNNAISKAYYYKDWDWKSDNEVDVVPGTALMIRKKLFREIGGFDEKFFLYFEEFDLCKRIKDLGYKFLIVHNAKVKHHWGASTKRRSDIQMIFDKSRFYYFKKHFGLIKALLTTTFLRSNKYSYSVFLLLLLSVFLNTYKLNEFMSFIGDHAWFYLSARDMILTGNIPLIGIESSRVWLHQGALWTYMLAPWLWISHFYPVSGAYFTAAIGVMTVYAMYKIGTILFTQRVGFLAALLCCVSPFMVMNARIAYHTSPIPLFVLLLIYTLYKWITGKIVYFPISIFLLGLLYNLELATFIFLGVVYILFVYGFVKKQQWAYQVFTPKIIIFSILAYIFSMFPTLLYDTAHGYPQTIGFLKWFGYKILVTVGILKGAEAGTTTLSQMVQFLTDNYRNMFFATNTIIAIFIFAISCLLLLLRMQRTIQRKADNKSLYLIGIINLIAIAGLFASGTPSGAYVPMIVPGIFLITAYAYDSLFEKRILQIALGIGIAGIMLANVRYLLINNFYHAGLIDDLSLSKTEQLSDKIIKDAEGRKFNVKGRGPGSQYRSFTMPYEYITWWKGHAPSSENEDLVYTIITGEKGIRVEKNK